MDDDLHVRAQRHRQFVNAVRAISQPRYSLTDLRGLAREYADERHNEARLVIQLSLSCFVEWLAKREQGEGE